MLSLVRTLLFLSFLLQCISAQNYDFNDAFKKSLDKGTVQIVGVGDTKTRVFPVTPQFFPVTIARNVGETISFRFFANSTQEFSVTEGTLTSPCIPKPGGFSSGVIRNPTVFGQSVGEFYYFNFTVVTPEPFYYFANTEACTFGMAGGINTPGTTSASFRRASIALADSPQNPFVTPSSPTSPTTTLNPQATSSSASDSSGQNITLVLVATPLGIAGILFGIFGVITYVRRLRRARALEAIDQESGKGSKKTLELENDPQAFEMGMKSPSIFELWGDIGMKHLSGIRPSRTSGPPPKVPSKDGPVVPGRVQLTDEPMNRTRMSLKRATAGAQTSQDFGFRSPELTRPASSSAWVRNPGLRSPAGVPKVSSLTGLP